MSEFDITNGGGDFIPTGNDGGGDAGPNGGDEQPPKRARGRPRKSDGGGVEFVDPASLGTDTGGSNSGAGGSDAPRRRGRKPGAAKAKSVPLDVNALAMMLAAAQMTALKFTGVPEFQLSAEQNAALSEALSKVARHYPIGITEKQADIMALIVVSGNIAFSQVVAYKRRIAQEGK